MKRITQAIRNNRQPIAEVLADILPPTGSRAIEVASGPGAHAAFFAEHFPSCAWQPTDVDPAALASIAAWVADHGGENLLAPLVLDAAAPWPELGPVNLVLNINMLHVSPYPRTAVGLFRGAANVLDDGGALVLYGPFLRADVPTAESNLDFDRHLRARDSAWGLRSLDDICELAAGFELELDRVVDMPANNLVVVFRR